MTERSEARLFLEGQFPEKEIDEVDCYFAMRPWLTLGSEVNAIDAGMQEGLLEDLRRLCEKETRILSALHPSLLKALGGDAWGVQIMREYALTGIAPRVLRDSPRGSPKTMPRNDDNGLKRAKAKLCEMRGLSAQEVKYKLPQQVQFMREAARIYSKYTGRTAPRKAAPGTKFFKYIEDLIECAGTNTKAASVIGSVYKWEKKQNLELGKES